MGNERIEAILKDPKKYTESANFTTPAIKCNGDYLSASEIIDRLDHIDKLEAVREAATKYHDWLQGLTLRDRWGLADALEALNK